MEDTAKTGRTAALIGAVAYTLAAVLLIISTIMENKDSNDDMDWVAWVWIALVVIGTIGAAVALYALLKRTVGLKGLAVVAVAVAALAVVASLFGWVWMIFGILLSIAYAFGAGELRKHYRGVAGRPTTSDWIIPAAWPLGAIITFGLWATDIVEESDDDLDWAYTIGFSIGALLTAFALVNIAAWLRTPVTADPVAEPADGPDVAGI